MKVIIVLTLLSAVYCAPKANPGAVGPPYVWDLQKPRMDAASVAAMLASKAEGQYPTYRPIPQGGFDCNTKKMPGYYADPEFQCQVYHRCDINGNMTSYICDNTTVFDQVTLICDYWFNVDCSRAQEFEEFANRRLYQEELPLFDTPPADYVAPQAEGNGGSATVSKANLRGNAQKSGGQVNAKAKATGGQGGASAQSTGRKAQAAGQAGAGSRTAAGRSNTNSYGGALASNAQETAQDQAESAE